MLIYLLDVDGRLPDGFCQFFGRLSRRRSLAILLRHFYLFALLALGRSYGHPGNSLLALDIEHTLGAFLDLPLNRQKYMQQLVILLLPPLRLQHQLLLQTANPLEQGLEMNATAAVLVRLWFLLHVKYISIC